MPAAVAAVAVIAAVVLVAVFVSTSDGGVEDGSDTNPDHHHRKPAIKHPDPRVTPTHPHRSAAPLNGHLAITRYVVEQDRAGRPLRLADLQVVVELLHDRRLSTGEVARLLQTTESDARRQLSRMVDRGLIEARGEGRGRTYHLAAPVYRALRESTAYVRAHGFEPLQQEQMVLSYVTAHGRITRQETADLCALSSEQAKRLLGRLTDQGKLIRRGTTRSTYYERAPQ